MLAMVFQPAGLACAIPCRRIVEVLPLLRFEPMPHEHPAVRGMLVHRGRALAVLDVSKLLAGAFSEPRMSTRLVLVGREHAKDVPAVALLCAAVRGVSTFDGAPASDGLSGSARIFAGMWLVDDVPIHCLSVDALVEVATANEKGSAGDATNPTAS